ncbi:LysR family transcriptional regulator [Chengkuizengella axinellae]|uniref:LysR family transcriptional regulator n=1 Tax=Chengkuizengella axinellae TaxID=3064388 RepID=A0ABT9IXS9_9BACL|nr:LysR family transcriptional regulator [Chengkuizengella sp. 2205SS18-9]MDP5274156.1 LysR family transcriptional regulator [Chengkuizengella sp. 2205SS18-9]
MDHHLRIFIAVAEKKNFTRAAEELHLTQSAVSIHIKTLEEKFGIKLFERTNKFVRLTKAGEILYFHAKNLLNQYAHIQRLIDDLKLVPSGPLHIGSGYTFGEYLLPKLISQFSEKHEKVIPHITVKNSQDIFNLVMNHEIELGIVEDHIDFVGLDQIPLSKDELVVIISPDHPLANQNEVEFEQLISEKWILRKPGSGTRSTVDKLFSNFMFSPNSVMEFGTSQTIKESVEASLGISIISKWAIQKEIILKTLKPLKIKNHPIERNFICITHPANLKTKTADLFLQFLRVQN